MKDLYIVTNDCLGRITCSLRYSKMDLLTLLVIHSKCSLKFYLSSENILRCFRYWVWFTWILLKINTGWFCLFNFAARNDILSLLSRIKVKNLFPLIIPVSCPKKAIIEFICRCIYIFKTEKIEVPSAKRLGFDDKSIDKSLM